MIRVAVLALLPLLLAGASVRAQDDGRTVLDAFARSCFECHGASESKAGLRLDVSTGLAEVLVAGSAPDSELFRRVALPATHDDAMPPEGPRLSDTELLAVLHWINGGPDLEAWDRLAGTRRRESEIATLAGTTGAVVTGDDRLRIDFSRSLAPVTIARIAPLTAVACRVEELSLAGTSFTAEVLDALPRFPALRRLRLERTALDDAGLRGLLERAPDVVDLNLHSTAISPAILDTIRRLPRLERVVVHDTRIAPSTARRFAAAHPHLEVVSTSTLPDAPFDERGPQRIVVVTGHRIRSFREVALETLTLEWELGGGPYRGAQAWEGNLTVLTGDRDLFEYDARGRRTDWHAGLAEGFRIHAFRRAGLVSPYMIARGVDDDRFGLFALPADGKDGLRKTTTFRTGIDEKPPELVNLTAGGGFIGYTDGKVWEMDRKGRVIQERETANESRNAEIARWLRLLGAPARNDEAPAIRYEDPPVAIGKSSSGAIALAFPHRLEFFSPTGPRGAVLGATVLEKLGLKTITSMTPIGAGKLLLAGAGMRPGTARIVELGSNRRKTPFDVPLRDGETVVSVQLFEDPENR